MRKTTRKIFGEGKHLVHRGKEEWRRIQLEENLLENENVKMNAQTGKIARTPNSQLPHLCIINVFSCNCKVCAIFNYSFLLLNFGMKSSIPGFNPKFSRLFLIKVNPPGIPSGRCHGRDLPSRKTKFNPWARSWPRGQGGPGLFSLSQLWLGCLWTSPGGPGWISNIDLQTLTLT